MDIVGTIAAVSASLSLVRDLKEIDASFDKAELKLKVAELTSALADAKLGLVEISETLSCKDREIADLKAVISRRDTTTVIHQNKRYFANKDGEPTGTPICSICEQSGYYLAIVQDRSRGIGSITYFCPKCKANYGPQPGVIRKPTT